MILLIDNYDSFTYNLYQQIISIANEEIRVILNDELSIDEIILLNPQCIIISPGPGIPEYAGVCIDVIRTLGPTIPILGVCLGHQAIAASFSYKVVKAKHPMHGKGRAVFHNSENLFKNIENGFIAARYHSLIVEENQMNDRLIIDAYDENKEIMALHHKDYPIYGIQFHPESVLTPSGDKIVKNFLEIAHVKTIS